MIKSMSEKLHKDFPWFDVYCECGNGWYGIIWGFLRELEETCNREQVDVPLIMQVKEKHHKLRIYFQYDDDFSQYTDSTMELVERYENESYNYCEQCGKAITLRNRMNTNYYCEDCYNALKYGK